MKNAFQAVPPKQQPGTGTPPKQNGGRRENTPEIRMVNRKQQGAK